jgi:hypothetical protein
VYSGQVPELTDLLLEVLACEGDSGMVKNLTAFVGPFLRGLVERCFVDGATPAPRHFLSLLLELVRTARRSVAKRGQFTRSSL